MRISDAEARLVELREKFAAGPTTLTEAAAVLGVQDIDLLVALAMYELRCRPGAAAMITGSDGVALMKPAGEGEVTITVPDQLAAILLAGLLSDPAANIAIVAPTFGAVDVSKIN